MACAHGVRLRVVMLRRSALRAAVVAAALLAGSARADEPAERVVTYANDRLTVHATKAPADDLLAEVGRASGAEIRGGVIPHDVTAEFDDVPLDEGLHRLLGDQNFLLKYGSHGLRAIVLLGGPAAPVVAAATPATVVAATSTTLMPSTATLGEALRSHPPVPVTGRLAQALGTTMPTVDQLINAALHQQDPDVRAEALRAGLNAVETDAALRGAFMATMNRIDEATLGTTLRNVSADHAEEFVAQIAAEAKSSEIRVKASSLLQRIRSGG